MVSKRDSAKFKVACLVLGLSLTSACTGMSSLSGKGEMASTTSTGVPLTPPTTPTLPMPPVNDGLYKVYATCESPATTYSREIFVDSVSGVDATTSGTTATPYKTLTYIVGQKILKPGDHVIIRAGDYATLTISKYNTPALVNSPAWVWFDFQSGANLNGLSISDLARLLVTGANIQKSSGDIVYLGGVQNGVVAYNNIFSSAAAAESLSVSEWLGLGSAAAVRNGVCTSIFANKINNVRFGISMSSDGKLYPTNSMKGLVAENEMHGFSGDASRGVGSDLAFMNNKFIDGYVSGADGDANHDDMFQGWALNGAIFENVLIEGNTMIEASSSSRKLRGDYQGICIFDGLYRNVVVRKNIVMGGAYHGIAMYGVEGLLIEENTVVASGTLKYWIGLFNSKGGVAPINNTVKNNLAIQFSGMALGTATSNNIVIANPAASYVQFDLPAGLMDFHLKNTDAAFGKGAGAL